MNIINHYDQYTSYITRVVRVPIFAPKTGNNNSRNKSEIKVQAITKDTLHPCNFEQCNNNLKSLTALICMCMYTFNKQYRHVFIFFSIRN